MEPKKLLDIPRTESFIKVGGPMVPQYPTLTSRLTFPTMSRFHQEMHDWPFIQTQTYRRPNFKDGLRSTLGG